MSMTTPRRAFATVTGPVATFTSTDGHLEDLVASGPEEDIRATIIQRAILEAGLTGDPIELVTAGDRGIHHLLVTASGDIARVPQQGPDAGALATTDVSSEENPYETSILGEEVSEQAQEPTSPGRGAAPEPHSRTSFITTPEVEPARSAGWRGLVRSLGIAVRPSTEETRRADEIGLVSQRWAGCRTIAVVNGKGGVGKTMTTAMIASVFARHGGGNVLAWDNNDTRGTLGWRTEAGLYDTTLRDLLPAAAGLLAPTASVSDIARFVHHQSADRYDVLRSNPELLAAHQRILQSDFDVLMQVAARYYRLVVFDSGNDESADRWLRMIDSSYQLVIPTLAAPEAAESAALLLDALRQRDERSHYLAENAVVVVTQSEPTGRRDVDAIVEGFRGHVRTVERIPFDPALKSGALRFDALRGRTQDAWLHVAAAAARGLG